MPYFVTMKHPFNAENVKIFSAFKLVRCGQRIDGKNARLVA